MLSNYFGLAFAGARNLHWDCGAILKIALRILASCQQKLHAPWFSEYDEVFAGHEGFIPLC